jgi:aminodeoxyfutalosine synthase
MTVTPSIEPLLERLLAGETATAVDRAALAESHDLLALGMAADEVRRRRHGSRVTFVRVADVPLQAAAGGSARWEGTAGEVRLTGTPSDLSEAVAAATAAVAAAGEVLVTGYSLADLERLAGDAGGLRTWVNALKRAGLAAIAEAPVDAMQNADDAVATATAAGLAIARLTVNRAPAAEQDALLRRAAELVAAHPELRVFAPLPRQVSGVTPSTGYHDVHLVALARLLVPVPHVQVDWQRYGPKLAQVALTFGADDVDGVSPRMEVREGRRRSPLEEIRRNIQAASGEPVERGALFDGSR